MKLTDENQDHDDARPLGRNTGHSASFDEAVGKRSAEAKATADEFAARLEDDPEEDLDDEVPAVTPPDVIKPLGFDPLDMDEDDEV